MFSETVRENIASEKRTPLTKRSVRQRGRASIGEEIESFPEQYRTPVGERGITPIRGQKQRTAIARAIIRIPAFLILDDASPASILILKTRLNQSEIMQGRTTIFISPGLPCATRIIRRPPRRKNRGWHP